MDHEVTDNTPSNRVEWKSRTQKTQEDGYWKQDLMMMSKMVSVCAQNTTDITYRNKIVACRRYKREGNVNKEFKRKQSGQQDRHNQGL